MTLGERETGELYDAIRELAIAVAVLTERLNALQIPKQPCKYFEAHLATHEKQDEKIEKIKGNALTTLIALLITGAAGIFWFGFLEKVNGGNPDAQHAMPGLSPKSGSTHPSNGSVGP